MGTVTGGARNIVTNGLVLYLDAANTKSYPSTGTTWFDLSGRGNNATLYNGPALSGGAIVMDGSNDNILAPSCNTLGGLADQALEIWVKTPGLGSGKLVGGLVCPDYGQVSYIDANGNVVYILYNTDTTPYVQLVNTFTSGVNMFDNKWHHVVCTRGSANFNVYIDGVSRASGNGGGSWSGATVWSDMNTQIGNNPNDQYYNLYGSIASVKIYKKYLTAQEVQQNFNSQKSRFGL
jgi:hypothetical protein